MLVASIIAILLIFEPTIIRGTPYNYYQQGPPSSPPPPIPGFTPPWGFNVPPLPGVPSNLISPESTPGPKLEAGCCPSPCCHPCCQPCCQPCCRPSYQENIAGKESCKKKDKKDKSSYMSDADSTKFFTALCSIPGLIADTIVNGQIVI